MVVTQKNGRYAWSITPNRRRARHHRRCDDATAPGRGTTKWDYAVSRKSNLYSKFLYICLSEIECQLRATATFSFDLMVLLSLPLGRLAFMLHFILKESIICGNNETFSHWSTIQAPYFYSTIRILIIIALCSHLPPGHFTKLHKCRIHYYID